MNERTITTTVGRPLPHRPNSNFPRIRRWMKLWKPSGSQREARIIVSCLDREDRLYQAAGRVTGLGQMGAGYGRTALDAVCELEKVIGYE
jgi:hypothetical protein